MSIDTLLNALEKVKATGHNKWLACCAVHDDSNPSMAITLKDDGRILLHCFGCGAGAIEIIGALGLDQNILFPPDPVTSRRNNHKRERVPFPASDILQCLLFEATVLSVAAHDICKGVTVSDTDWNRIELARDRIDQAINYAKH
jgi:hypothetical protein